nr:glycosyl transferase family protein [uncultured bacterium]
MTKAISIQSAAVGRVSIIIKALNEEKRIARAIESSLRALERVGGEVILADSCSTDQTINIAKRYPITIVQLANSAERCCGIGPQLGYQHSSAEYVYILDGDMELRPHFIDQAVQFLDAHPAAAGVGGQVIEHNLDSLEYKARVERNAHHMNAGQVDRLDMGGLYRRSAIEQIGYFSDRNLHSYEELDLAVRLRARGWRLHRINFPAVDHHGHDAAPYRLLYRRWETKYIYGIGEIVRAGIGKPHFSLLIKQLHEFKLYFLSIIWVIAFLIISIFCGFFLKNGLAVGGGVFIFCLLFVLMTFLIRKKTFDKAIYAFVSLFMHCAALIAGIFVGRQDPGKKIDSNVMSNY